jgi:hypothetical protein
MSMILTKVRDPGQAVNVNSASETTMVSLQSCPCPWTTANNRQMDVHPQPLTKIREDPSTQERQEAGPPRVLANLLNSIA